MADDDAAASSTRTRDGEEWQIGTAADVAWLAGATTCGSAISAAVTPVFDSYATILLPDSRETQDDHENQIVRVLTAHTVEQPWWLGYLDTGVDDVVFADAPRVRLYEGWAYIVAKAGAKQARRWRSGVGFTMHCRLPNLMFPADRTGLLSALWDDDWWSVGGSSTLVNAFSREPGLDVRVLRADDAATPPGHGGR